MKGMWLMYWKQTEKAQQLAKLTQSAERPAESACLPRAPSPGQGTTRKRAIA